MKPDYDIVFAGAGLSGLGLAVRLAALPNPPRMLLVDPREEPQRDRTWCHWQLHEDPFTSTVTHRWDRWSVRHGTKTADVEYAGIPYVRIPADRFHEVALDKLSRCPRAEFLRGISVLSIEEKPDHAALRLSDGRSVRGKWVFDSRPPRRDTSSWRQIFRGLELHVPGARLGTGRVTLMDFRSAGPDGIRFFYVLPLDSDTALVEDTWLVPAGITPRFDDDDILAYAAENLCPAEWGIRHREEGNLPMGTALHAPATNRRVIPWGTPAGAVRASSGYAYSRIQRASERMTEAWHRNGRPAAVVHQPPVLAWMDRVFLRVMAKHPARVPGFFLRLFQRVPAPSLIRFLESEPRPADIVRVMRSLPAAPFIGAALR